jgi:hypothetical protein
MLADVIVAGCNTLTAARTGKLKIAHNSIHRPDTLALNGPPLPSWRVADAY